MTRRIELDLLRTIAIVMMIVYHFIFDLHVFFGAPIDPFAPGWILLARSTAALFLIVSGMSTAVSWRSSSVETPYYGVSTNVMKYFRRIVRLASAAFLVSIITYILLPSIWIRFGVLHLLTVGALVTPLLLPLREWNLLVGALLIMMNLVINPSVVVQTPYYGVSTTLMMLGVPPPGFTSLDYFPLIPWLGIVLIGTGIGSFLYMRHGDRYVFPRKNVPVPFVLWPGRHALLVYLLHQPILMLILTLSLRS